MTSSATAYDSVSLAAVGILNGPFIGSSVRLASCFCCAAIVLLVCEGGRGRGRRRVDAAIGDVAIVEGALEVQDGAVGL